MALRAGAGAGLAAAAAGSGQVSGPFAAFALGVAAPLVVEKLSRAIPLTGSLVIVERSQTGPTTPAEPDTLEQADPPHR